MPDTRKQAQVDVADIIKAAAELQVRLLRWTILTRADHEALEEDLARLLGDVQAAKDAVTRAREAAPEHAMDARSPCGRMHCGECR